MFKTKNTYYLAIRISKKTIRATFLPSLFKKTIFSSLHFVALQNERAENLQLLQCILSIKI